MLLIDQDEAARSAGEGGGFLPVVRFDYRSLRVTEMGAGRMARTLRAGGSEGTEGSQYPAKLDSEEPLVVILSIPRNGPPSDMVVTRSLALALCLGATWIGGFPPGSGVRGKDTALLHGGNTPPVTATSRHLAPPGALLS